MAFCEPVIVCRKHRNHKQQPGVCSCCLRERLAKLAASTKDIYSNASSLSTSTSPVCYYSSASSSTNASPRSRRPPGGHHRTNSDVMDYSLSFANMSSVKGLKKSRSIAFVARNRVEDAVNRKKKGGFWSKLLLRSTGKKIRV